MSTEPTAECAHCGNPARGYATVHGKRVCHHNDYPDCYRLITVYGEEIGSRKDEHRA